MATYKVLQDIEAEDKLVGPLTLWQFIYAAIAALCVYLSVLAVTRNMALFLVILVPIILVAGFLAAPLGKDQPTEVWALAKLRFFIKPRKRVWDQDGMNELVTITVPKKIERVLTDGLSQHEVRSRLSALAATIDSRGWATKNVNINLVSPNLPMYDQSDRLISAAELPTNVVETDIRPDDDILDETANPLAYNVEQMVERARDDYRSSIMQRLANNQSASETPQTAAAPDARWFAPPSEQMSSPFVKQPMPQAQPTPDAVNEAAISDQLRASKAAAPDARYKQHMTNIATPDQIEAKRRADEAAAARQQMTIEAQTAILKEYSKRDDLTVDTVSRQANQDVKEIDISLRP